LIDCHGRSDHILDHVKCREADQQRKQYQAWHFDPCHKALVEPIVTAHDNSIKKGENENDQQLFQDIFPGIGGIAQDLEIFVTALKHFED